ncbi:MAG TPA: hypothetical protein PLJ81_13220, partial [Giesbergeria sp.]|nr:hypothetical protein [Giesbergeria sp.]
MATGPKGAPKKPPSVVAALDKGTTIACALRLAGQLFRGSESANQSETLHKQGGALSYDPPGTGTVPSPWGAADCF